MHFSIVQNHGGCKGFPKEMMVSGALHFCRDQDGEATRMNVLVLSGLACEWSEYVYMLVDSVGYVG